MGGSELKYIHEAFDQNWIAPLGPNVDAFERKLADTIGVKHAAALVSGTSAIHLALILLGVKPGDYVIGQSMTFSATINPIVYQGATPVLIDSEPDTWNMDPGLLEEAIVNLRDGGSDWARGRGSEGARERGSSEETKGLSDEKTKGLRDEETKGLRDEETKGLRDEETKGMRDLETKRLRDLETKGLRDEKTGLNNILQEVPLFATDRRTARPQDCKTIKPKAIIVTHLYGMPAKMKEIMEVADRYEIPVIEDAAEALGSEYMGKRVGGTGKFGILSFNGNKIITTSGGGALLSDDRFLIRRARFLSTQAREVAPHYQHLEIGYNYRMSNVVAGIGLGQLEVLDERVRQRRSVNQWYRDLLKDVPGVTFHTGPSKDFFSNHWLTCIVVDPEKTGTDRERLRLAFEAENIEARPLWKPMHLQPVFAGEPAVANGTSEKLFEKGLCLPSGSNLTDDELNRIREVLKREFSF